MTKFQPQFKIRELKNHKNYDNTTIITIPKEISVFFKEVSFFISRSGNTIILQSGCSFEQIKQEAKKIDLEKI